MHFEINLQNTLMLGVTGSHAYGTATATSDVDRRGVVLTPLWLKLSTTHRFEQHQGDVPGLRFPDAEPFEDCTIYDVCKAAQLISACNPNMVELLWLPDDCVVFTTPAWAKLVDIREVFLSTKAQHTFSGYAFAQWKKIASHRSWLLEPMKAPPTRKEYGLPEQSVLSADDRNRIEESIEGILRGWGIEDLVMDSAERDVLRGRMQDFWATVVCTPDVTKDADMRTIAGQSLGLSSSLLEILKAERAYRAAIKHWGSYQKWKAERNPDRAQMEAESGYDRKHAMHLVRLLRMGTEVLSGKGVIVRRPDAEELLAIRQGLYSYEQLDEIARGLMIELESAATTSELPKRPDIAKIDAAICDLYGVEAMP